MYESHTNHCLDTLQAFRNVTSGGIYSKNKAFVSMAQQPLVGLGFIIIKTSRSHPDTPQSLGLLWTSDQPDAETST